MKSILGLLVLFLAVMTTGRLTAMVDTAVPGCDFANSGTDCGYNVDTAFSEVAYMYHTNLGLKSKRDASGVIQADFSVFDDGSGEVKKVSP